MSEQRASYKYKAFISYSHTADKSIAPALQSGLQRITASWRQLRAIHVYRDETDIPTTSALLPKIKEALRESEFFILLASTLSASSPWVQIEVDYWLSINPIDKFLIVLTEGAEPIWDPAVNDFLWEKNTSLPPNLKNRFKEEPKFLDLRWARGQKKLKLRERRFYEAVADLSSTLRGIDKSTLVSEDARQLRRNRRLAWSAVLALLILFLATGVTAIVAFDQRNRALEQEAIAHANAEEAKANAEEANRQKRVAEDNAREAVRQQGIAKTNEEKAKEQEGKALANAVEARRQQGFAEQNAAEAKRQQGIAERNLEQAQRENRLNIAQRFATQSGVETRSNPQRAGLWAAEAVEATQKQDGDITPEARAAANRALTTLSGTGHHGYFRESVEAAIFNKDETLVAAADWDGVINVFDLRKQFPQSLSNSITTDRYPTLVAFDAKGRYLITHSRSQECRPDWFMKHKKTDGCGPGLVWMLEDRKYPTQPVYIPGGPFESMAVSRDNSRLAAATRAEIILYDLAELPSLPVIRRLRKNVQDKISAIEFSADGGLLLSGSQNGWVQIWELTSEEHKPKTQFESGHMATQLGGETNVPIDIIHIADDRSALITASRNWVGSSTEADLSARLWNLSDLKPVGPARLLTHKQAITSADFIASSRSIITTSLDGEVRRWELGEDNVTGPKSLVTARCDCDPSDPFKNINAAAVSPDEGIIAVATSDEAVRLISLKDADKKPVELRGFDSSAQFVAISPSGKWLVSGGIDRSVRVWDIDGESIGANPGLIGNWRAQYLASGVSALGTAALLVTADQIEVWNLSDDNSSRQVLTLKSSLGKKDCPVCQINLSPDGKWVVVQSDLEANVSTVYAVDGSAKFTIPVRTWFTGGDTPFSPDSRWLLVNEDGGGRLYDLSRMPATSVPLEAAGEDIYFGAGNFSKDSKWLFAPTSIYRKSGGVAGYIWRIDPQNRDVRRFAINDFEIGEAHFSDDGQWFAYSATSRSDYLDQNDFMLGDPPDPSEIVTTTTVRLIHLSRDAERLEPINLNGHELKPDDLIFSPDGRWLLTTAKNILARNRTTRARLWDLNQKNIAEKPLVLPILDKYLRAAVFSPDGRFLVTIQSTEDFARLWHLDSSRDQFVAVGALRGALPKLNYHWKVVFSPDSKRVVISADDDPTPYIWFLAPDGSYSNARQLQTGDRELRQMQFAEDGSKFFVLSSTSSYIGGKENRGTQLNMFDVADPNREATVQEIASSGEEDIHRFRLAQNGQLILLAGKGLRGLQVQDGQSLIGSLGGAVGRNMTWEEWVLSAQRGPYHKTFQVLPIHASVLQELTRRVSAGEKTTPGGVPIDVLLGWTIEYDEPGVCNELAWSLAMVGEGRQSLRAVECALKHFPNDASYRDTRGVARALLSDTDGAIEDFKVFVQSARKRGENNEAIEKRQMWIKELSEGRNPFLSKSGN